MKKVLIVDDSLLDRKLLSRVLLNAGMKNEILQAEHGDAALEIIGQNLDDIAIIFLDYQMPHMSGLELMEGLMKVPMTSNLPIVMVTASTAEDSKKAAYDINPRLLGYIHKPIKPTELLEIVKRYAQF